MAIIRLMSVDILIKVVNVDNKIGKKGKDNISKY
jgi:hypothetical protein